MKIQARTFGVNAIAALLIFMFAYTAISKFFNFSIFRYTLKLAPLIGGYADKAAILLSVINLVPVLLLIIPRLRRAGFIYSAVLLILYSGYIGYALLMEKQLPCSCSGIAPWLSWKEHLWVNFGITVLAIAGFLLSKRIIAINPQPHGQGLQQGMLKTCIKE